MWDKDQIDITEEALGRVRNLSVEKIPPSEGKELRKKMYKPEGTLEKTKIRYADRVQIIID